MVYPVVSFFMVIACVFAILENVFLMPIILLRSGKEIGSYKMLLFLSCFIAVIYTSIALIVVPTLEPGEKGWLFYSTEHRVPQLAGSYLIATFANCYIMLMLILECSFLYRYFVMCSQHQLKWFNKCPYVLYTVFFYFLALSICAVPIYVFMCQNADLAEIFEKNQIAEPVLNLTQISYVGAPMFGPSGWPVPETALILTIWTIAIVQFTIVCSFCISKIMHSFQTIELSATRRRIQYRLFVLLLIQTVVPCIFTYTPALLSYGFAIFRVHFPIASQVSAAVLPIAHVIDPIMILLAITDYRRQSLYLFKRYVLCRATSARDRSSGVRSFETPS